METGSILDRKRSGRPSIDEETVDAVHVAFHRSPRKSIRVASNELAIPRSTVHKVQFSSVQFSFISAPPHEQNNKMLKSLCVVKDGVRKRKKQQNELTLCLAN